MSYNVKRTEEDIKREVSLILREVKDSRVGGMVSITRCELSNDKSHCKIYVSCLDGEDACKEAVKGLESASGFIKKNLGQKIKMRVMPELKFIADNSLEYYERISEVIEDIHERDEKNGQI